MEIGNQSICFLDLRISIVENKLTTTVYSKPAHSHLYLHADSCHKKSSIRGIQKGVALRLHCICSSDNDYTAKSIEYTKYFVNRGHDLKLIQQCFNNVGKTSQQEAQKKVKPSKTHGPNVNKTINRNIHLLLNNDNLKELIQKEQY